MALAIHGTPAHTHDNSGSATSVAAAVTTTVANTILIAVVAPYHTGSSGPPTVTGVSGAGLTWTKRASNTYPNPLSGTIRVGLEVWWALAPSAVTAQSITATLSSAPNNRVDILVFAVSGSPNLSAPWDVNVSLPGFAQNAGSLNNPTRSINTSATNSMLLGFVAYAWNANAANTAGSGFTDILAPTTDNSLRDHWESKLVSAPGAQTVNLTGNQQFWVLIGDALNGDTPTATTGTITTALTKPSQALAGTEKITGTIATALTKASQSVHGAEIGVGTITTSLTKVSQSAAANEKFTGTVATNLTKASQAASGFEKITGTATTNLTKASQSLAGTEKITGTVATHLSGIGQQGTIATEQFLGTINTALTRISQTVTGAEEFDGTITTHLSGISQTANGLVGAIGDIATHLSGISQFAKSPDAVTGTVATRLSGVHQAAVAKEIFAGVIQTDIDSAAHLAQGVVATESFVGTITTRLTRANFALTAEEIFVGQCVTRLGNISGSVVAVAIEASEIILGDIDMVLPFPRSLLLGAQLGAAGEGNWYSWRYTDG